MKLEEEWKVAMLEHRDRLKAVSTACPAINTIVEVVAETDGDDGAHWASK